jgi:dihydrofolate synthase/folylpolyglutamate synthase
VIEVGLGGRLDATNIFDSTVSVITKIAIDHIEVLGSDVASIAIEKAGIVREGGTVVCGATGQALDVIRGVAAARKARLVSVEKRAIVDDVSVTPTGSVFDFRYEGASYDRLVISMLGRHQVSNASTALVVVHELARLDLLDLTDQELRRGLSESRCTGRMQIIDRRPTVLADVAHNPDGAEALATAITQIFTCDNLIAVVGMTASKDIEGFFSVLAPVVDSFILTRPSNPRAATPERLAAVASDLGVPTKVARSVGAAIETALSGADEGDLVLITGSHYTVGDALVSMGVGQTLEA